MKNIGSGLSLGFVDRRIEDSCGAGAKLRKGRATEVSSGVLAEGVEASSGDWHGEIVALVVDALGMFGLKLSFLT